MKNSHHSFELSNGTKLLIKPIPGSYTIDFRYFVNSGFIYADPKKAELPHLLEHLILLGNQRQPDPAKFAAEMEKYTSNWGGLTNRYQNTFWYVKSPRHFDEFLDVVVGQMIEPILADKAIEEQKEVIVQELSKEAVNERVLRFYSVRNSNFPTLFPSHEQRITSLKNIEPADVRDYFNKFFTAENTSIVITGNIDPENMNVIKDGIESKLTHYRRGREYKPQIPLPNKEVIKVVEFKSSNPNLVFFCLSFDMPGRLLSDLASLKVLQAIWAGGKGSRMYQKVRPSGLTYSPISIVLLEYESTRLALWDDISPKNFSKFLGLALAELRDIADGNFTKDELERAKLFRAERETTLYPTPSSWAATFGDEWALGLERPSAEELASATEKVTAEQVVDIAKKYLSNWQLSISDNHDSTKEKLETIISEALS